MLILSGGEVDFSSLIDSFAIFYKNRVSIVSFQYGDSSVDNINGYGFSSNVVTNILSNGIRAYAAYANDQRYSLISLTAVSSDSLIIPTQASTYTGDNWELYFPLVVGYSWENVYHSDINFLLSLSLASYDHAPAIRRRYIDESNDVIGWGSIRVTDIYGNLSPYFNILQVKTRIISTDSIFIDDLPAPSISLTALSLVQGKKDTTFEYNYYRKGEVTPLVKIEFKDAAYTQPYRGTTHVQRIFTNAVPATETPAFSLYPNPVSDGLIHVRIPAQAGEWTYQLTGVDGRIVVTGKQVVNSNYASIPVSSVPSGMYLLKIEAGTYTYNTCVQVN
jgi:hypothetical protein